MKVVSLDELERDFIKGEIISIPSWSDNRMIGVRVRQVSMINILSSGAIPNELIISVNEVFRKNKSIALNVNNTKVEKEHIRKYQDLIIKEALIEPSLMDLKSRGLELTDIQRNVILGYALGDDATLARFRTIKKPKKNNKHGKALQTKTERNNRNKK